MSLFDRLKLGKHYRMERFTLLFFTILVCMLIIAVVCFIQYRQANVQTLGEQAVYSTSFTTSRTNISGSVEGVYASSDDTKAFVLLYFSNTDNISMNAANYQMFLTAVDYYANNVDLSGSPSGSIYMFGSTGYMGIYLVNQDGFTSQILDLVVRLNVELMVTDVDEDEDVDDASFVTYDQFRIYFNPAGSEAESLECLEGDSAPTMNELYYEMVIVKQELSIHEEFVSLTDEIRIALAQIDEYEERMVSEGIVIPDKPEEIVGDSVIETEDGTYAYDPSTVLQGGWDLDWENVSIYDGFLDDLIAATGVYTMTSEQYMAQMYVLQSEDSSGSFSYDSFEWRLTDGTLIADLSGSSSSRYTTYTSLCNNLVTAWKNYYNLKSEYQRDLMGSLLDLELDFETVLTGASINSNSDVLLCY